MNKKAVLTAAAAIYCSTTYCLCKAKKKSPYMSKREMENFNRDYAQPIGYPGNIHPGNIILSKNCSIAAEHFSHKTMLNNNILAIGCKPNDKKQLIQANLLQRRGSYIVIDSDGELLATTGKFFEESGYNIHVLNLADVECSNHYNPLFYMNHEDDAHMLARIMIESGDFKDEKSKEAGLAALNNALLCLYQSCEPFERTFQNLYKMILKSGEKDDVADDCKEESFSFLNSSALLELTKDNEIDLYFSSNKPTVLYIIPSPCKEEYKFLIGALLAQVADILLRRKYEDKHRRMLKYPMHIFIDDTADVGIAPASLVKLISSMRLGDLSCSIFFRTVKNITNLYPELWGKLITSCDTVLCFRTALVESAEEIVSLWGWKYKKIYKGFKKPEYKLGKFFKKKDFQCLNSRQVLLIIRGKKLIADEIYEVKEHLDFKRLGSFSCPESLYEKGCHKCQSYTKSEREQADAHNTENVLSISGSGAGMSHNIGLPDPLQKGGGK